MTSNDRTRQQKIVNHAILLSNKVETCLCSGSSEKEQKGEVRSSGQLINKSGRTEMSSDEFQLALKVAQNAIRIFKMPEKGVYRFMKKHFAGRKKKKKSGGCEYQISFDVVIFGCSGVGKTSIVKRLTKNFFTEKYSPTTIEENDLLVKGDAVDLNLKLHDISNEEEFSLTRRKMILQADAYVLVFSATDRNSFEELDKFRLKIEVLKQTGISKLPVIIIGNKSDLQNVEVTHDEVMRKCLNEMDSVYIACSAKEDMNISGIGPALYDELGVCGSIYQKVTQLQCAEEVIRTKQRSSSSHSS